MLPAATNICDTPATRAIYAATTGDTCACSSCRNMRAQFDRIPPMVLDALHAMGIDPAKPGEIIEYGRGPGGYTYEIEWPFISAAATAGDNGAGALQLAEGDVSWRPGGVPAPEFDRTQRRWSLSLLLRDVPWTLREPQPHT